MTLLADASGTADTALRTEYPFTLPRGYVDQHGVRHRDGVMRLATARDELTTQNDPRARQNPAYLTVLLLERTVTRLGDVRDVDTFVIENLFASDLAFLQDLYRRINQDGHAEVAVECPQCGTEFAVDIAGDAPGGIVTYAADRLWKEVAYVGYYLHWGFVEILDMDHGTRQRVIAEVGAINARDDDD